MGVCNLVRYSPITLVQSDVYDLVHTPQQALYNMAPIWYWVSPIWSDLLQFGQIWSDLVIRVTRIFTKKYNYHNFLKEFKDEWEAWFCD